MEKKWFSNRCLVDWKSINWNPLLQMKMLRQFWFLLMTLLRFLNLERTIFHSKEKNRQSKFTFTFRSSASRQISDSLQLWYETSRGYRRRNFANWMGRSKLALLFFCFTPQLPNTSVCPLIITIQFVLEWLWLHYA